MSPSLHTEIHLEDEICEFLHAHEWLYRDADATKYDRALVLYPPDVLAWVQQTQKDAWVALVKAHGGSAGNVLLNRLRDRIAAEGTLHVLRHGIDMLGLKGKLQMAQFKPALAMNPELSAKYNANRLRMVRQVKYSQVNENCIDLVLFLNGIPVATAELKSDFTQSVEDAVAQYKYDRHPKPKVNCAYPLARDWQPRCADTMGLVDRQEEIVPHAAMPSAGWGSTLCRRSIPSLSVRCAQQVERDAFSTMPAPPRIRRFKP